MKLIALVFLQIMLGMGAIFCDRLGSPFVGVAVFFNAAPIVISKIFSINLFFLGVVYYGLFGFVGGVLILRRKHLWLIFVLVVFFLINMACLQFFARSIGTNFWKLY